VQGVVRTRLSGIRPRAGLDVARTHDILCGGLLPAALRASHSDVCDMGLQGI
jgi:hypothetical protein